MHICLLQIKGIVCTPEIIKKLIMHTANGRFLLFYDWVALICLIFSVCNRMFKKTCYCIGHITWRYLGLRIELSYIWMHNNLIKTKLFRNCHDSPFQVSFQIWVHKSKLLLSLVKRTWKSSQETQQLFFTLFLPHSHLRNHIIRVLNTILKSPKPQ